VGTPYCEEGDIVLYRSDAVARPDCPRFYRVEQVWHGDAEIIGIDLSDNDVTSAHWVDVDQLIHDQRCVRCLRKTSRTWNSSAWAIALAVCFSN